MIKVVLSSGVLVLQKMMARSIGIVSTMILARLLTPEDFGLVAIAMLALWFATALSNTGSESYILQKDKVSDDDLNSAWTLDIGLKSLAFIILCGAAPIIAWIREDPEVAVLIVVTGTVIIFQAISNPGLLLLKREQNYTKIVKWSVFAKVIGVCVAVSVALYFQNYWALVGGQLSSIFVTTVSSYWISSHRPKLCVSEVAAQWDFSKWLLPRAAIGYFRNHIDTIIVSSAYPAGALGSYNNMKYFASIPMLQVISPLLQPLHAEFGKVKGLAKELEFQANFTIKLTALLVAPVSAFLFFSSEQIVFLVLGSQWLDYNFLFGYFGLLIIPFILLNQSFRLLMIGYRTKKVLVYELIATLITLICLFALSNISIQAFGVGKVSVEFLLSTGLYIYVSKVTFKTMGIRNLVAVFGLSAVAFLVFFLALSYFGPVTNRLAFLFITSVLALLTLISLFCLSYFTLFSSREKKLIIKLWFQICKRVQRDR